MSEQNQAQASGTAPVEFVPMVTAQRAAYANADRDDFKVERKQWREETKGLTLDQLRERQQQNLTDGKNYFGQPLTGIDVLEKLFGLHKEVAQHVLHDSGPASFGRVPHYHDTSSDATAQNFMLGNVHDLFKFLSERYPFNYMASSHFVSQIERIKEAFASRNEKPDADEQLNGDTLTPIGGMRFHHVRKNCKKVRFDVDTPFWITLSVEVPIDVLLNSPISDLLFHEQTKWVGVSFAQTSSWQQMDQTKLIVRSLVMGSCNSTIMKSAFDAVLNAPDRGPSHHSPQDLGHPLHIIGQEMHLSVYPYLVWLANIIGYITDEQLHRSGKAAEMSKLTFGQRNHPLEVPMTLDALPELKITFDTNNLMVWVNIKGSSSWFSLTQQTSSGSYTQKVGSLGILKEVVNQHFNDDTMVKLAANVVDSAFKRGQMPGLCLSNFHEIYEDHDDRHRFGAEGYGGNCVGNYTFFDAKATF